MHSFVNFSVKHSGISLVDGSFKKFDGTINNTKTDLTDFFDQWGFFVVGKMSINDYDHYEFNVTQQMVDNTKSYIASKGYPKLSTDITITIE